MMIWAIPSLTSIFPKLKTKTWKRLTKWIRLATNASMVVQTGQILASAVVLLEFKLHDAVSRFDAAAQRCHGAGKDAPALRGQRAAEVAEASLLVLVGARGVDDDQLPVADDAAVGVGGGREGRCADGEGVEVTLEVDALGDVVDDGEQKLFGDTVRYELLCRTHYRNYDLGT